MQYFLNVITRHYADFSGRARRKEYWLFFLFGMLSMMRQGLPMTSLGHDSRSQRGQESLFCSPV